MTKAALVDRREAKLREWARRCRELSDMTVVPDVSRELIALAREMEDAAENAASR